MFKIIKQEGHARRGEFETAHGTVQTPVFMNVGTQAAIKGALSAEDLETIGCQIELSNTYHLHIRPGDMLIRGQGGLHRFMTWDKPILTDSGGFQIFSLAKLRKITEEGVAFNSHVDGKRIFMSPEDCIRIQSNLGSDIAMAFDECVEIPSPRDYVEKSCERTYRWLVRCRDALAGQMEMPDVINRGQMLFGINQGATFPDVRINHMKQIAELELPGYAIGGLAVGESVSEMYDTIEIVEEHMPKDKPRYLMGVGTPVNIIEAVARGVDFFDCVMPARNGRHGHLYTWSGVINIKNEKYSNDSAKIDAQCACPVCQRYSRAYLRHLFKAEEMLALRLSVMHNLYFYNNLMLAIRNSIENGTFQELRSKYAGVLDKRLQAE
jgi:queuine tRNA-ribosyltransferase